jgi:hypothetical protein
VKEISCSLSIPFDRKTVFAPVYPSVRTILTAIHRRHPKARFTLDLSGGSKPLCMALLAYARWLGGDVYSAFDELAPRNIPLPERSVQSMMENPNYQTILAVLIRNRKTGEGASGVSWVSRQYLYQQVWPYYTRSRTRSPGPEDPGKPVVRYRRGRKPAPKPVAGNVLRVHGESPQCGLVEEGQDEKNRKEKAYRGNRNGRCSVPVFLEIQLAIGL